MSRVLAVNRCVLILGITLYIGFLNQTFLARNGRRIKKDGNFFFVLLRVLAKEKFFLWNFSFSTCLKKILHLSIYSRVFHSFTFFPNVNYCFEEDKDGKADISCHGVGNFAIQIISLWRDPPHGLSNSNTGIS